MDRGGRVLVEPDFSIPNHPEIRVVGDLCSYKHTADGKPLPGMAGPAVQMGGWVAKDIRAQLEGRSHKSFAWFDFGSMAVLGRLGAVADLRGIKLAGLPAWGLWLTCAASSWRAYRPGFCGPWPTWPSCPMKKIACRCW